MPENPSAEGMREAEHMMSDMRHRGGFDLDVDPETWFQWTLAWARRIDRFAAEDRVRWLRDCGLGSPHGTELGRDLVGLAKAELDRLAALGDSAGEGERRGE